VDLSEPGLRKNSFSATRLTLSLVSLTWLELQVVTLTVTLTLM